MIKSKRLPNQAQQQVLPEVRMDLATPAQIPQMQQLLDQPHSLRSLGPVGQRLFYIALDAVGRWLALLVCRGAAKRLIPIRVQDETKARRIPGRCTKRVKEIRSSVDHFKALPAYRARVESYPLFSLAALFFLAVWCEAPRGQTDLAKSARGLNQGQRRALGLRPHRPGRYKKSTKAARKTESFAPLRFHGCQPCGG